MKCPRCQSSSFKKKGSYQRKTDGVEVARFQCKPCGKSFSEQTFRFDFYKHRKQLNEIIFRVLSSGVSQRRAAWIIGCSRSKIDGFVGPIGKVCGSLLENYRQSRELVTKLQFDELETFIHTKLKPVTVPIAVEKETRKILGVTAGDISAKGKLSEKSKAKYGPRECQRDLAINTLLESVKVCCDVENLTIQTDKSTHYPSKIKKYFPKAIHIPTKGKRGCVTGQGEMKRGGFDELFSLNHSYAMFRDNIKRLTRRTWCTSKRRNRLLCFLNMYAWAHNGLLDKMTQFLP